MTASTPAAVEIGVEPAASADDVATVTSITELINRVYVIAEAGLWVEGARRTNAGEDAVLRRRE
jgi:hypothetical protein